MCKNVLVVLYHHVKFSGAWHATGGTKNVEFSVCQFVTLSVENVVKFEVFAFLLQHGIAAY